MWLKFLKLYYFDRNFLQGSWFWICRCLNVIGIISNSFIIGFTSNWSKTNLNNGYTEKLIFVGIFEVIQIYSLFSFNLKIKI